MAASYPMSFELAELTAALENTDYMPQLLGSLGLFSYRGIRGITAQIERRGTTLQLLETTARGAPGVPIGRSTRDMLPVNVCHIQADDTILADEVLGEREFGTEDQPSDIQMRLAEVLGIGRQAIEYTMEYHRVGALKGVVYDKNGTKVLADMYQIFGVEKNTDTLNLSSDSTKLRVKFDDFKDKIFDELGGISWAGVHAVAGKTAWKKFVDFKEVRSTYENTADAALLRSGLGESYSYADITVRRYRGKGANGQPMIDDNKIYFYPVGVRDLFIGRFGCADYWDAVNQIGLPLYAQGVWRTDNRGVDIEMQSNPLHLCTRPRAVLEVTVS